MVDSEAIKKMSCRNSDVVFKILDNIFPMDFYRYKGKNINEDKINDWIVDLIDTEEKYAYIKSGNTIAIKFNEKIIIAKDYWENKYETK